VLGAELGAFIRALHEQHGVVFHLGQTVTATEPGAVILRDGQRLAADFVVAGIGVSPNTALAERARLAVRDGIVVDPFFETDARGVFAIGDAARWPDSRDGGLVRIEHWVVAQRHGQAVARTLAGDRAAFTDVPFFWTQQYDLALAYVGHAERWDAIEIDGSLERRDVVARYRAGGTVRAMASVGRDRASLEMELAMERRAA
jgi:NADPH-dependent 2,4-dienoyl-CoA reductase/sulfur reductase-like enzyme